MDIKTLPDSNKKAKMIKLQNNMKIQFYFIFIVSFYSLIEMVSKFMNSSLKMYTFIFYLHIYI